MHPVYFNFPYTNYNNKRHALQRYHLPVFTPRQRCAGVYSDHFHLSICKLFVCDTISQKPSNSKLHSMCILWVSSPEKIWSYSVDYVFFV